MAVQPRPAIERIQARMAEVDTSDPSACHQWPGARREKGYGVISLGSRRSGLTNVTRVVLEHKLGRPLGSRLYALHTCDNPPCCNPAHLYEGTRRQNTIDALKRGQHVTKLTEDDVRAIHADTSSTHTSLARKFDVSRTLIAGIRAGRNRALVTNGTPS